MLKFIGCFVLWFCCFGCGPFELAGAEGTPCGENFCTLGTYCADEGFGSCLDGCKSDFNCAVGDVCVTGEEAIGNCIPNETSAGSERLQNGMEGCVAICDELWELECMIDFDQWEECRVWCGDSLESEVEEFALCVAPTDCYFQNCF